MSPLFGHMQCKRKMCTIRVDICTNCCDHCPIFSQGACESVPIASPGLSFHWLVAHPMVTHHYHKMSFIKETHTSPSLLFADELSSSLLAFCCLRRSNDVQNTIMLEQTHHSSTTTLDHLYVYHVLDLVWIQIS